MQHSVHAAHAASCEFWCSSRSAVRRARRHGRAHDVLGGAPVCQGAGQALSSEWHARLQHVRGMKRARHRAAHVTASHEAMTKQRVRQRHAAGGGTPTFTQCEVDAAGLLRRLIGRIPACSWAAEAAKAAPRERAEPRNILTRNIRESY